MYKNHIVKAFEKIKKNIQNICHDHTINKENIEIIAVAKTFPEQKIIPLLEYGHKSFGENKVQEAQKKWPQLKQKYKNIHLHLIGPLQSNKVKDAIQIFDSIHTLDREKLARILAREMNKSGKHIPLFIQVNSGEEPQKSGIFPQHADAFIEKCRSIYKLNIIGLMSIPPIHDHAAPHFALLEKIAKRNNLSKLSMGMSADYDSAVKLGATHIRIGSAIFGHRDA